MMAEGDTEYTENMTNVELSRYKNQLEELRCLQQAALASSQQTILQEESDDKDTRILELQNELWKRSSFKLSQSLTLQRLQMGDSLLQVLFNEDVPIPQLEREYFKGLIGQQRELSSSILAHQEHCDKLRAEQEQLQNERRELTQLNRALMKELSDLEQAPKQTDNENLKRLYEDNDNAEGYLSIVQNVLQGLIVGSGLNWAQDPELQELLLSLGE